jgi:hypothetical protein
MILAAIAAYVIDRNWKGAIGYSLFGALCAYVGFIHATELRLLPNLDPANFSSAWGPTVGYLSIAALLTVMMYYTRNETAPQVIEQQAAAGASD